MAETSKAAAGCASSGTVANSEAAAAAAAPRGIQFNPISRWEEPLSEVPGLTLWDVHCEPRQVKEDPNDRIRVSVKQLASEFHCPVCLGYMTKPVTVMECLHRFCTECLEKCLRIGKKECPSCRIHIPSRRSLRNDNNFEEIMRCIYGDIEKLEKHEEKEIEILNRAQNMNNASSECRKVGITNQNRSRGKKRPFSPTGNGSGRGEERAASTASASSAASATPRTKRRHEKTSPPPKITGLEESPMISFALRRHPQEIQVDRLDKEILKTSKEMSIDTLKKFLSKKLSHAPHTDFQITCTVSGEPAVLEDAITVGQVQEEITDKNDASIMVLRYRIFPTL